MKSCRLCTGIDSVLYVCECWLSAKQYRLQLPNCPNFESVKGNPLLADLSNSKCYNEKL